MTRATIIPLLTCLAAQVAAAPAAARDGNAPEEGEAPSSDGDAEEAELRQISTSSLEMFSQAVQAYDNGEYQRALEIAMEVDVRALDREQRITLHEIEGRVLFILGDEERGKEQFFEVLKLDPQYEPDRFRTPERIRWGFYDAKDDHARELQWYPVELWRTVPGKRAPLVARRDRFFALLPFGAFQFGFLHTPGRGTALALSQGLSLAGSVVTYVWLDWSRDRCSSVSIQQARPTVLTINIVVSAAFVVFYAAGVIDGFGSQRYHGAVQGGPRHRTAAGWRWGPPVGVLPGGPD